MALNQFAVCHRKCIDMPECRQKPCQQLCRHQCPSHTKLLDNLIRDLGQEPAVRNSEWNRNSLVVESQRVYLSRVFNSLVAKFIWFRLKNTEIF
ncbi:unnamed protein product [Moneuplotes crassus]|uniref:Uncharacterized protein n=1 Tax=Euplotes crassus TaxID=5936 RepID=A0AAD1XWE3_EUPCR|nr:unnamed protein product [Moneuplotes crassus]